MKLLLTVFCAAVILAACSDPTLSTSPNSVSDPTPSSVPTPVNAPTPSSVPTPVTLVTKQWPPAPRPTPTPGAALVLPTPEPSVLADEAYAVLSTLATQYSPRESGTDQEKDAALYLEENLETLGYDIVLQEFDTPNLIRGEIDLVSGKGKPLMNTKDLDLYASAITLTVDSATGLLTFVGEALPGDIPTGGLEGRIALIEGGTGALHEQVRRVEEAGAEGAIVLNLTERLFGALSRHSFAIPVISVYAGGGHGAALRRLVEQEQVTASISVAERKLASQNVVATMRKRGDDDPPRWVILSAHYDTVANTQGAGDNGSGLASLLTIARHIAGRDYPFDIRIVLFGAEEAALDGIEYFVENMGLWGRDGTIAMLNFDTLGSGSTFHVTGDHDLTSEAIRIGKGMGVPISLEGRWWPTTEPEPFEEAGIPTMFMSSNDTSRINSPEDTIEHINPDLLGYAAEIGIAMLDRLANEPR